MSTRTRHICAVTLALFIAAAACVALLNGWHQTFDEIRRLSDKHGTAVAALVFFCANTILCAIGAPRLWTGVAAGVFFGGWEGLLIALPSSALGAWIVFEIARMLGQARFENLFAARANEKLRRIIAPASDAKLGIFEIALARQIPLHGGLVTLALAMTRASRRTFIIGSTLGFLPGAIVASFAGDIATARQTAADMALPCILIPAAIALLRWLRRGGGGGRGTELRGGGLYQQAVHHVDGAVDHQ